MAPSRACAITLTAVFALAPIAPSASGSAATRSSPVGDVLLGDLPDVPAPQIDDPISDAELEDLQTLADQEGASLDEVVDRYAWNDNFGLAVDLIRAGYPGALTGAEIVHARAAWVGFAAGVPDGAMEILDTFQKAYPAIAVDVRRDFGFSEIELREAISTVHYAALEATGIREVNTVFDFDARQITSTVAFGGTLVDPVDDVNGAVIARLVGAGLGDILDTITIKVIASELPTLGGEHSSSEHLGGEALSDCTSGFSVQHWDGRSGIVIAEHCQTAQSDDGKPLTFQMAADGYFGDFQWHTGPQSEPDDFYSGNATTLEVNRRDVSGVQVPVVGQAVCKNGKAGYKDCDTVRVVNVCSLVWCNMVETEHQYGVGGDSGGPWFWNYTAYGVHHGWFWDPIPPFDRSLFSQVSLLFNALDIQVRR